MGTYYDDAIHIADPAKEGRTLCDQTVKDRNVTPPEEVATWGSDWGAGCWTCIAEFEKWEAA